MRALRANMTQTETEQKSRAITERFLTLPEYSRAETIFLYMSAKNEPNTFPLAERALMDGKRVAVPVTDMSSGSMYFSYIHSLDDLHSGAFGILEPICPDPCDNTAADIVVTPGLVFDTHGGRVGYGKGFYDRFFAMAKNAVRVAFCYDFQIVQKAATEAHDVPMNIILTEGRTIYCDKG